MKNNLSVSFALKDKKDFWKDLKKLKSQTKIKVETIDNANDPEGVLEVFNKKFKSIFDDKKCQGGNNALNSNIRDRKFKLANSKYKIYDFNVVSAIQSLNNCLGCDGLHSNHFKFSANGIKLFMSRLFSSFLCHGYIPIEMLMGKSDQL